MRWDKSVSSAWSLTMQLEKTEDIVRGDDFKVRSLA
jgi:hypothetical protein